MYEVGINRGVDVTMFPQTPGGQDLEASSPPEDMDLVWGQGGSRLARGVRSL